MPRPKTNPSSAPRPICRTNEAANSSGEPPPSVMTVMRLTVRKTAIGSLLPDSSSSRSRTGAGSLTWRARSTENTAAASVDETTAPSSSDSARGRSVTSRTTPADEAGGDEGADGGQEDAASEDRPDGDPARVQPAREQDQRQRDDADRLGDGGIVEVDAAEPLRAGEHPDAEEEEEGGHAGAPGRLAREDADEDEDAGQDEHQFQVVHRASFGVACASGCLGGRSLGIPGGGENRSPPAACYAHR